jgi:hypothetical protein
MSVQRFLIETPDATIRDLSERLARARFTAPTDQPWKAGTDPEYLRILVRYWLTDFDWRAREQELNSFPDFITKV